MRVSIARDVLDWAIERSGKTFAELRNAFPKLPDWQSGKSAPTWRQAQEFAAKTYTPFSLLFLPEPPAEPLPIADMRTLKDQAVAKPSGNLLDTIYHAQRTQDWYRDYAIEGGARALDFVGSVTLKEHPNVVAKSITEQLDFGFDTRQRFAEASQAYRHLVDRAEDLGVLVLTNGVVGNNTHRLLDVAEFRGFSLSDDIAPLIFVNGADSPPARVFTLLHELGHIWLGHSALSDLQSFDTDGNQTEERWCNRVAAEVLLPDELIGSLTFRNHEVPLEFVRKLAKRAKCSSLVVLHRLYDAELLDWQSFQNLYSTELAGVSARLAEKKSGSGGDFYNTVPLRYSPTFTRAVLAAALDGTLLYRDALQMIGTKRMATFRELADKLGVAPLNVRA